MDDTYYALNKISTKIYILNVSSSSVFVNNSRGHMSAIFISNII